MAFKIVWTTQAIKGYDNIINYLEENWPEKEASNFANEADRFFDILMFHPEILQRTAEYKNVYRGPINSLTMVTYRIKSIKKYIELISIRSSRQKPLKLLSTSLK
jgi:plasmid stabilization system protein ParE